MYDVLSKLIEGLLNKETPPKNCPRSYMAKGIGKSSLISALAKMLLVTEIVLIVLPPLK
jgi:predicted AAA+ superfamily ATPase